MHQQTSIDWFTIDFNPPLRKNRKDERIMSTPAAFWSYYSEHFHPLIEVLNLDDKLLEMTSHIKQVESS